jgi:hypothetical protein
LVRLKVDIIVAVAAPAAHVSSRRPPRSPCWYCTLRSRGPGPRCKPHAPRREYHRDGHPLP